jgi:AcrR family transcriptional regulator
LLEAGVKLFGAYGFRHTSMEGIAAGAGVAKATAYAHFANKEEVFAGVVEYVATGMIVRAEDAADQAKTPEAAVLASLISKEVEMYRLVNQALHARELLDAITEVGGKQSQAAHTSYIATLAKRLARCKSVGARSATIIATLLERAGYGLMARATNEDELRSHLSILVERTVGKGKSAG